MKKLLSILAILACWISLHTGHAWADLVFSSEFRASFDLEVLEGPFSAIGGIAAGDVLPLSATGTLTFVLDDSNPGAASMAFLNVTGSLTATGPVGFMPFELTPNTEFIGGLLENIQRDSAGLIVAADVVGLQMMWEMSGKPAILGGAETLLYTVDALEFNGAVSSVPFTRGDILLGQNDFELYLDEGLGNPGLPNGDPLVAIGRTHSLTVVPEPGSIVATLILASSILFRSRRMTIVV